MIEPALRDKLTAAYESWLDQDDFGQRFVEVTDAQPGRAVISVLQFLQELLRASSGPQPVIRRPTPLDDPDSTFAQLLGGPLITPAGPRGLAESFARHVLCLQAIPRLMLEVSRQDPTQRAPTHIGIAAGGRTIGGQVLPTGIDDPADRNDLADLLMSALKSRLGQRKLRSFFMVDTSSDGYRLWAPQRRASQGAGKALARHTIETGSSDVSIDVMRYAVEDGSSVRAYEWCAELRDDAASELPDAITYGMAYCFDRIDGTPAGGRLDLMTAADTLADVDLLQVTAFFEQHDDAQALIDAGDLAFVWLWERRSGARPGVGRACLEAALADLRRRLRNIRTVVIDLKPYQFVVSDAAGMPTSLHVEKLDAVDRLQSFVDGLNLGNAVKGQCRYIVNRDGDDPKAAMRALGHAAIAQYRATWLGDG
ncbi:MAG: hypothetical protein Q8N44_04235 [Rubrivivax sp.]|nr:hypothetical protein [Rubrivivax sp.]